MTVSARLISRLSWEDFRLVAAVAEAESLPAAADRLGLSHSTVFRRLNRLEAVLGLTLFDRRRAGFALTSAGEEMVAAAEAMAERAAAFAGRVEGREIAPAGELRVATSDALLSGLLAPILADFSCAHPAIELQVTLGNPSLNISRRDADVAVRATRRPPESLVGRQAGVLAWALYAAQGAETADPAAAPWVAPSDELADLPALDAMRARAPGARVAYRVNSMLAAAEAIERGMGLGYLPCFLGDARPGLRRLGGPAPALASGLWLLTHPDLRRAPRVRVFLDALAARLAPLRPLLAGETPFGAAHQSPDEAPRA